MEKTFDPRHRDIRAFAQAAAQLKGEGPVRDWPRLADEQLADAGADAGRVQWQVLGRMVAVTGGAAQVGLSLQARAELTMQCQRCLTPVMTPLLAERDFLFVADEATAEAMDEESDADVLVISRDFDVLSLVEDELILALPLVPRHDVCPRHLPAQAADEAFDAASERPNPFAALAALKKGV